jgi:malate/lactate dehydrogenase
LVDHRGLVATDVIGALAHLQMARAQKMMGHEASARKWDEEFLTIWNNADPDIPIHRQAKAEYAKLRKNACVWQRAKQLAHTVPHVLHPDANQQKRSELHNNVRSRRPQDDCQAICKGVAEIAFLPKS